MDLISYVKGEQMDLIAVSMLHRLHPMRERELLGGLNTLQKGVMVWLICRHVFNVARLL
jgi:hypothetical protein